MSKTYLLAIDSFKECITSEEAAFAARAGILDIVPDAHVVIIPVSDGGEGMLHAFCHALHGQMVSTTVHDPLLRQVEARYGISSDGRTAIIETAEAIGLHRLDKADRNPMRASSYGVGDLILAARDKGCTTFIVGLGGSSTCDGGVGMMQRLKDALLSDCRFIIASDVDNPLYGPQGAAYVFAPQKGADSEMTELLDQRLFHYAEEVVAQTGRDMRWKAGAGAAGGIGFALMSHFSAETIPGAELLLRLLDFDHLLHDVDVVITGEGKADCQTLMGKLPYTLMRHAQRQDIPTILIAGRVEDQDMLLTAGFKQVINIHPSDTPPATMMRPDVTRDHIKLAMKSLIIQ